MINRLVTLLSMVAVIWGLHIPTLSAESPAPKPSSHKSKVTKEAKEQKAKELENISMPNLLTAEKEDIVLGNPKAPLTMVEYASLSCGHCASFYNTILPELKKNYLDTGKVKLIYRHFPLNASASKAAVLVQCAAPERREKFLSTLYKAQKNWAFDKDYLEKLRNIGRIGGLKAEQFDACMQDKAIEEKILLQRLKAEKAGVDSTPTLFLEGKEIKGKGYEDYTKQIDDLLKVKK